MARSVARDSPSRGCGLGRRGEEKLQCHDQKSSSGGCRQASKEAGNGAGKRGSVNQASILATKSRDASQCAAIARRRCG